MRWTIIHSHPSLALFFYLLLPIFLSLALETLFGLHTIIIPAVAATAAVFSLYYTPGPFSLPTLPASVPPPSGLVPPWFARGIETRGFSLS